MPEQPATSAPQLDETPQLTGNAPEFTVTELSGAIKRTLESGFDHVRVRGELGRISRPASGHLYVDLKDERSVVAGVMWRGVTSRLRFKPEQGMEVVATGRLTTFPGQSKYQLVIESLQPAGVGALMALLDARKKQLTAEGLFEESRKKPLPFLPRIVGIVTSPTGAVIRDMLHGFEERFPTKVLLWPVRVQGESCAAEVAAAIRGFNALPLGGPVPRPDVIIVARGGGSLEDLWGFNEEVAVRAAADSELPLISAVGHETDWTLIDLAADARAPTPTKAAEWAVPKYSELLERLLQNGERQRIAVRRGLESARDRLKAAARGLPRRDALFAEPRQRLDRSEHRLASALVAFTNRSGLRLTHVLARLSPRLLSTRISGCRETLTGYDNRGRQALMRTTSQRRVRLVSISGRLRPSAVTGRLQQSADRVAVLDARARQAFLNSHAARRQRLGSLTHLLQSLSYHGVLARGFALVRDSSGAMVRKSQGLQSGHDVEIEFADGRAAARVLSTSVRPTAVPDQLTEDESQPKQAEPADGEARRPTRKGRGPDQGSLF